MELGAWVIICNSTSITACLQLGFRTGKKDMFVTHAVNLHAEGGESVKGRAEGKVRNKCKEHKFNTFPLCEQRAILKKG